MRKQTKSKKKTTSDRTSNKAEYLALVPFWTVLLALLIGSFQKSYYCWGFSTWNVISSGLAVSTLVGGLVVMLLLPASPIKNVLDRAFERISVIFDRIPRLISVTLISIFLFFLCYLMRSKALVYGDGFLMLGIFSAPASSEISGQGYVQILSTIFNRSLIELSTTYLDIGAEKVLAIINIMGGIAGFWAMIGIIRKLADDPSRRIFLFFAAISSGATLLCFGHIENYTWPISLSLWCLYFLIKYLRGETNWLLVAAFASLAFLFHAITGPMLMVALLAGHFVRKRNADRVLGWSHGTGMCIVVGILFLGIIVWQLAVKPSVPDLPGVFVTLWPVADNLYWFLSLEHIVDILNLMFFLAPLGILLLLHRIMPGYKTNSADAVERILAWLTLLTFLEIFWIDPELGAPRDWDLLAIAGFPLSLWAAYRFSSTPIFSSGRSSFAGAALIVAVLHLGPHIYEKSNAEIAVERLDALLWECPHYQTTYNKAFRGLSWGTTLNSSLSRDDLAEKYFTRRLSVDKTSSSTWFNLGQIYHSRGVIDSSGVCLTKAVELDPKNSLYLLKLADVRYKQNKYRDALALVSRSEALDSENPTVHTTKAIILYGMDRVREALIHFHRAHELEPRGFDQNYNLGAAYYALSDYEKAYPFLKRAITTGARAAQVFEKLIPVQLKLGKEDEAAATLQRYRLINPGAKSLDYYRTELER